MTAIRQYTPLDEVYEALVDRYEDGKLDALNLNETIKGMRQMGRNEVIALTEDLLVHLQSEVEARDLCPECFQDEWMVKWSEPGWYSPPEPLGRKCNNCGRVEA